MNALSPADENEGRRAHIVLLGRIHFLTAEKILPPHRMRARRADSHGVRVERARESRRFDSER